MLIATFGPTTAWVGKRITRQGDAFVLEGHGPISAGDIMEYDRQGHLVWVDNGTRAWVGSKAKGSRVSKVAAATATAAPSTSEARGATTDVGGQPSSRTSMYLKRALLVAIAVLIVANVVLILVVAGVVHGP
jgi:hypothetical protein